MRGDNCPKGNLKWRTLVVHGASELEAFDLLGPMAQQAIREAPIKWQATAIMIQIAEAEEGYRKRLPEHMRESFRLDPKNPELDRNIARGVMQQGIQLLMQDRSREDAELGIKPIRRRREPAQIRRANYRGR